MRRLLALSIIVLALAGCGRDEREPFFDTRTPPQVGPRFWPPDGWAWGALQVKGAPPVRYGVAAATSVRRAHVIVLPGYGESAEWWFETASDLNREGYTVWALDPEGQGGSGRFTPLRDLGHTPDFAGDIDGLNALIQRVVRPPAERPVIVIASGTSARALSVMSWALAECRRPMASRSGASRGVSRAARLWATWSSGSAKLGM